MRALIAILLSGLVFDCAFAQIGLGPNDTPLLVTLDHNDDFVITAVGQRLVGINFQGPEGAFESAVGSTFTKDPATGEFVGQAPAPFDFMLTGRSDWVSYGSLSSDGPAIGSFPLQFGPSDVSFLDQITIEFGIEGNLFPVPTDFGFVCETCNYPTAVYKPDGGIEVTNVNDPIIRITVFSNDGGLVSVTEVPAGVTVVSASETEVTLEKLDGFDTATLQNLDFFEGVSSSQPVFVKFGLESGGAFGPMEMARSVPEPNAAMPMMLGVLLCLPWRRPRG